MTSQLADDAQIKAALEDISRLIADRVKREQRRDQLTGLENGLARDETLADHVTSDRDIWAAFVEVDKFKSINDQFGYQNADELLKALGLLLAGCAASFPGAPATVQVFRAHGDEFFIVGAHDGADDHRSDLLHALLGVTCEKVRGLALPVVGALETPPMAMRCTVSIGWLVSADVPRPHTARSIIDCLERAVDEAKRTRDCVVRYAPDMAQRSVLAVRADCSSCRSKFSIDIPVETNKKSETLHCPNCGEQVPRPPGPLPAAVPTTPVVV